jgi:RNA polymerase sigma-70 factor (subfamily 1)
MPDPSPDHPPAGDPPEDDSALIEAARGGDEGALGELVRLHADRLLESIRAELGGHLRRRLESQDVIQEVHLDALRSIAQFAGAGHESFFAWLRQIAIHRIIDLDRQAFRTVKRGPEKRAADLGRDESMARLLGDLSGSVTTPSMAAIGRDRVRLLDEALGRLGEAQRQAIELRYLERLNVTETAAKMGRTEKAVRALCVRALIQLREILGDAI